MVILTSETPIAVIGGGFSGAATALHLARLLPDGPPVTLFERGGKIGRGIAYSTVSPRHLLNVRAANMSAFPDDPGHFERWLAADAGVPGDRYETEAGLFASRPLYARYLHETFEAGEGARPCRVHAEIADFRPAREGYLLSDTAGEEYRVRAVVLAIGHIHAPSASDPRHFTDPWDPAALAGLDPQAPVLIRGTALTMVDIVLALRESGFKGPITALSRRGLLPLAHRQTAPWPLPDFTWQERGSVLGVMRRLRREVARAREAGIDWRAVVDAIRPVTTELWQGWSTPERRRFLRHARRWWDIHRHRLAPPVAAWLDAALAEGGLTVEQGHLSGMTPEKNGLHVTWTRPDGETRGLSCQRVIDAIGLTGMRDVRPGLIGRLMSRGLARIDELGIGLDVDPDLAVRGADGKVVPGLWALGPIVRGTFWECIAVPDIRRQAIACAERIAAQQRPDPSEEPGPAADRRWRRRDDR